ncbi:MAG: hypothetical protein HRT72_01125 [Flavobacteriales bacterium]|nr:hypothetical protein [Flavobacteriales bacterium]
MAAVTFAIAFPAFLFLPIFEEVRSIPMVALLINGLKQNTDILLLSTFFFAIGLIYFKKLKYLIAFLIISVVLSKLITKYVLFSYLMVGIFLPTIIHVYLFTMLFMIAGTIKSKSKLGMVAIGVLLLIPIIIWLFPIDPTNYLGEKTVEAMSTVRNFQFITFIGERLSVMQNAQFIPLTSGAVKLQIFIAFSYTYHYLNWFSKTSLIGWNRNISRSKIALIVLLWVSLVGLSIYDYEVGYLVLYGFAMLHIIFPLNIACMKEVGSYIIGRSSIIKKPSV